MPERTTLTPGQRLAWTGLALVGAVFAVLATVEMLQNWLPLQVGEPDWEFGTTSHFFDIFPFLGLGLALLIGAGVAMGRRWQVRTVAILGILVAVAMWLVLVLWATVLPITFRAASNPALVLTLKKAAAKTAVQALVYPFALLWLAGAGWRATSGRGRPES